MSYPESANASAGYKQAMPSRAPDKETVSTIVTSFDRDLDRLEKLVTALHGHGDLIEGTRPQEVGTDSPEPPVSSLIDALRRKGRRLSILVSRCEDAMGRIQSAFG